MSSRGPRSPFRLFRLGARHNRQRHDAVREYPRAVCWAGVIGGVGWVLAGLLYSKVPGIGSWVALLPVVPVAVWMLVVGWLAWRRGDEVSPSAVPGKPMR